MSEDFSRLTARQLRHVVHALLRESGADVALSDRGLFVDFHVTTAAPLGVELQQRYRLFVTEVTASDVQQLREEAEVQQLLPIVIAARGCRAGVMAPIDVAVIDHGQLAQLAEESGVLVRNDQQLLQVDHIALRELRDASNKSFAFVNGLLHLRSLARNRVPPALRWTGVQAYELFERCFFLVMTTSFRARGVSWGTKFRGKPYPDGMLELPNADGLTLYDCKAASGGYHMEYRDLTGFADYLREHGAQAGAAVRPSAPRFLIVSSEIHGGKRDASFAARRRALAEKVPGAQLTWMRASDLARFGLAIEQAEVAPEHRERVRWGRLCDVGDVRWDTFEQELRELTTLGYSFSEVP